MAVTSIWSVKGWLGKVVIYIQNPEKTTNPDYIKMLGITDIEEQSLSDVIAYAVNQEKTNNKADSPNIDNEDIPIMQQYVTGVNCTPMTARAEMMAVKKRYGKDEGIMAFHGYQSFAPYDNITPDIAHRVGILLAEELWGNRFQVLIATHLDKENHLHNHFVVNSVSFIDGLRYHRTKKDYYNMRTVSDKLCRQFGLSVIETAEYGKSKHYGEWKAEKEERPTWRGLIKFNIDNAISKSYTEKQFYHYLKEMGYSLKFGKDITVRPQGKDRGMKLARNLGDEYTKEAICRRILNNYKVIDDKSYKSRTVFYRLSGNYKTSKKIGGLRGLYFYYCYLLGVLPKKHSVSPSKVRLIIREDLIKLDKINKETRLLCRNHIDTVGQLFSYKENLQVSMKQFIDKRQRLRYKSRNIKDMKTLSEIKTEISDMTKQICELRKDVKLCDGIMQRSVTIKEKLKSIQQEKEERMNEHIRRSR